MLIYEQMSDAQKQVQYELSQAEYQRELRRWREECLRRWFDIRIDKGVVLFGGIYYRGWCLGVWCNAREAKRVIAMACQFAKILKNECQTLRSKND